jgi:hypothetical protein
MVRWTLAAAAATFAGGALPEAGAENVLCRQPFALCTSAPCVPLPGDPTKATCSCDVLEGASMATAPCDTLLPSTGEHGVRTVYSTFSLEQFSHGKKTMRCPEGTPWTWCLDRVCTVDPNDPKKAVCLCDVKRAGAWVTLGGDCDTATCETGYWSGAPVADYEGGVAFLNDALDLDPSPAKECSAD